MSNERVAFSPGYIALSTLTTEQLTGLVEGLMRQAAEANATAGVLHAYMMNLVIAHQAGRHEVVTSILEMLSEMAKQKKVTH